MYVGMCVLTHTHTNTHTHAVHEEDQAQELAVDAARGRHERRQESHVPVAAICVTIIADLVGRGALEDVVRVVGVAELALMLPYLTSADGLDAALFDRRIWLPAREPSQRWAARSVPAACRRPGG